MIKIKLLILLLTLNLAGCAYHPDLDFNVPDVKISSQKFNAELKSLSVSMVHPVNRNGAPVPIIESEIVTLLQKSLKDAFDKNKLFLDEASLKIDVNAKIFQLWLPNAGLTMTTQVGIRYEFIDRKNEVILFTKDIATSGIASMEYITGTSRYEASINRAISNNIAVFLQEVEFLAKKDKRALENYKK